jgi:hypothetical protein
MRLLRPVQDHLWKEQFNFTEGNEENEDGKCSLSARLHVNSPVQLIRRSASRKLLTAFLVVSFVPFCEIQLAFSG